MSSHVCPWWMGYVLASPIRRLWQDPEKILLPHIREGMTVLEVGPGMGFFTLELARLVGPTGRVIVIDSQPKMLAALERRAKRAKLADRIVMRAPVGDGMGAEDLNGQIDFILAFAVVHELPNVEKFFRESVALLKPNRKILLAEPKGHVDDRAWDKTIKIAYNLSLRTDTTPAISRSHSTLLTMKS